MAEPFSPNETEDVTGIIGPESVYSDVVDDDAGADDADADARGEDTEPAEGMAGLA